MTLQFGAFGKVPSLGDFFKVGLPRTFVQTWDTWLQRGIMAAKADLGPSWNACYNSAPLWRFTLPPRVAGPEAVMGIIMPSVDRVGRQYPLTLVGQLPEGTRPLAAHLRATAIFDRLEDVALDALDGFLAHSDIEDRLADMPAGPGWLFAQAGQHGRFYHAERGDEAGAMPDLVASMLSFENPRLTFWSTRLEGATRAMALDGLPEEGAIRILFDVSAPMWDARI